MLPSIFDNEVEKYIGFIGQNDVIRRQQVSATPGRFRERRASSENNGCPKRPSSACSVFSPETSVVRKLNIRTPKSLKFPQYKSSKDGSKSLRKKNVSPLKTPKTPKESDRFIPPRASMNFQSSNHRMMQIATDDVENINHYNNTPSTNNKIQEAHQFQQGMRDNIQNVLGDTNTSRILQYKAKGGCTTPTKKDYEITGKTYQTAFSPNKTTSRKICLIPERVLDAPNYIDDYYLNLLHWSPSVDLLAVALDDSVYIWTPSSGDINHLCELEGRDSYVTSVQWIEQGCHLAVGTVNGAVQLWDVKEKKKLRDMTGHAARVGCLSWNSHLLSSGSRNGDVHNLDVRKPEPCISSLHSHTQEVCGLEWSPSGRYLASGSNDNKIVIWEASQVYQGRDTPFRPIHSFNYHNAAVKAIAWCPWQHNILASGGGNADKTIRFWNVNSGTCLNVVETDSQVSSLLWNETYKEIISGHGYPNNQLTIWQYPNMTSKAELLGHTSRVLQMTLSTDGTRVMSAAGDETLRLWRAFELTMTKRKEQKKKNDVKGLLSLSNIR